MKAELYRAILRRAAIVCAVLAASVPAAPARQGVAASRESDVEFTVVTVDATCSRIDQRRGRAHVVVVEVGDGVELELVAIPGGAFQMGISPETAARIQQDRKRLNLSAEEASDRIAAESPRHTVTVRPFLIGRYEVTQAQWRVVAAMPKVRHDLDLDPSDVEGDDLPVSCVSWRDAREFCARLSRASGLRVRLPSEAEWEYACRAGTTTAFHLGPTLPASLANFWAERPFGGAAVGFYREDVTEVGSFRIANAFGLYDMHGNVAEWCSDPWHASYDGAPATAESWEEGGDRHHRAVRGGSWYDSALDCRSSARRRVGWHDHEDENGLRVVVER